ncbi:MAG: DUF6259 domain-containing protein [Kiritimatiellae bacterium]|nr:DUF6259 domain-containing protein [Kiritimatiellia bacterium]
MRTLAVLLCVPCVAVAAVAVTLEAITLGSGQAEITLSRANGSIVAFAQKGAGRAIYRSGGLGMWSAELEQGRINAAQFNATNALYHFSFEAQGERAVDLIYNCQALKVVVHVKEIADGFELSATTTPNAQVLKSIDLPAKLIFQPQGVERLIFPADPDHSVGIAFNRKFFGVQPLDSPSAWQSVSAGSSAFIALYGKGAMTLGEGRPLVKLSVTEEGGKRLPADLVARINRATAPVIRPSPAGLCDLTLVDSKNGAFFSASRLGGNGGYIWRIGDGVSQVEQAAMVQSLVVATLRQMMGIALPGKGRIALLDLKNGPESGFWSATQVAAWRAQLELLAAESESRFSFVQLTSISELEQALSSQDYLCIVNPYGEGFPAVDKGGLISCMAMLKKFVHAGSHWFEVGGYSFYQMLSPAKYLRYEVAYPTAYADLLHLESSAGAASIYRAQPREHTDPWQAAGQHEKIFIPGHLYCGGDEQGGYMGRAFTTWVAAGRSWTTPAVHLTAGAQLAQTVAAYCAKNSITVPLAQKIKAETLVKFKAAPLLYLAGSCKEKSAALDTLPVPALIHFADYLHGGFDKQYPDHLPPNPKFGTQQEFKAFVAALHAKGHLFSPYTNPTWWCDDPKGATFEREGVAPLLVQADGNNRSESYADNPGWTTTLWHPAVRSANRRVLREFLEDLPVDMLFQDQCGARGFLYDFNPDAPTPYAYCEGMLAMNDEDSRRVPLGTEHGWDRVANFQTMLCGLTWGIVPTRGKPVWSRSLKKILPPETWEIYPLAQALSHDKCIFGHHDLGQFVTDNRSLVWTLALGYHMSYRVSAVAVQDPRSREWYAWLCRIQRSIGARYTGAPLTAFAHNRQPMLERDVDHTEYNDDGTITAAYGDVRISANLGPVARVVNGQHLAPYGFYAEAPGMTAGILNGTQELEERAFVAEHTAAGTELWLYGPPGATLSIPTPLSGTVKVTVDSSPPLSQSIADSQLQVVLPLPEKSRAQIEPSEEERLRAPCNRPGERALIGVINLGPGAHTSWTKAGPETWIAALNQSSLATLYGLQVQSITNWQQLDQALKEGAARWLAIVNPYGESILTEKKGGWQQTLDAIRGYVNHGGSWWESGGHSFHQGLYREGEQWQSFGIGPKGLEYLNIQLVAAPLDGSPVRLSLSSEGQRWLRAPFASVLGQHPGQVNRAGVLTGTAPVTTLVLGGEQIYVGGYRLGGWGHLWRIGGMNPNQRLATSVMIAATLHQYTNTPEPVKLPAAPRLWHVVVEK